MDADMILLVGMAICFFAVVYGIVRIVKLVMEQRAYAKRREEEAHQIAIEQTRKWRESLKTKAVEKPLHKESPSDLAYMRESNMITANQHRIALAAQNTPPKPSYASSPTQSVSTYQDNFISDVVAGMAINALLSNVHKSADPVEERSVGVRQSESSWGFDDSDSRKSISSSMDTSSSSDSWSSSSSDSGPSSDW